MGLAFWIEYPIFSKSFFDVPNKNTVVFDKNLTEMKNEYK
jgi:hypothetical protein